MIEDLWRFLVIAGRAFEKTRIAKVKIGRKTLLAHLFGLFSALFPTPEQIRTFWNNTIYLPKRANYELLILGESLRSRGSTAVFRQRVKSEMAVVDVGANIGYYTLLAASLVGEQGRVYAFEPDPVNYALLERNVQANGYRNVVCRQQAVSNKSGETKLFAGEYGVSHSLTASAVVDPNVSIKVATTTLDDFFQEQGWPHIDFIKMNIEGWEWFAIQGMTQILRRSKDLKMIVEFYPDLLQKIGIEPAVFIKRLKDADFTIQIIDEEKGLLPFDELNLRYRHGGNILCEKG